ncbi:unnamed protein product [Rotaria sp. Silwood1]|nr:unnamed protein product [Rotaria sp. Silwood1]CAF1056305.1 unnamed protein product [Rotaria sp. Silwood1]CAF1262176.1 unnamed protein product [Rotaria sp. Silwood1]CAF3423883.1 unnamed protein product [Rotaria sp. Silwood1]CAF3431757.1 unnamed protein product [Rotaria sp. Silwood1]
MNNIHTAKKPTVSSSFYDSYTTKPVKWYEIVDAYRQYNETYLPIRLENFPKDLWDNFKKFFKSNAATEEVDDDNPVVEVERTRADGNIIKVTEYNLSQDKFDPRISDAVRTHSEKVERFDKHSRHQLRGENSVRSPPSPVVRERRRHRHKAQVSPTFDDCPECRALAAQGYPTMCDCNECRAKRAAYPNRVPYCDCPECRNTKRS